MEEKQNHFS